MPRINTNRSKRITGTRWDLIARGLVRRFTQHPKRYVEILNVVRKYDLHHVATEVGLAPQAKDSGGAPLTRGRRNGRSHAEEFAMALEELGPLYVKLGQLLSTRPDLMPADYIDALCRLQNRISPVPTEEITSIIQSELGAPVEKLFKFFDHKPLAAASMAQVHRALLPDGTEVAVKVLRPGVRERTLADIQVMKEIVSVAKKLSVFASLNDLAQMVRELEESIAGDIDYRIEVQNTARISSKLADFPRLTTPTVYGDYSTSRVLTLGFVRGRKLANLTPEEIKEMGGEAIATDLLSAYLRQIVVEGIFHCDPHPGNIIITEDNRLCLLDFGMVGRFDATEMDKITRLLLAFSERHGQDVADIYLDMINVPSRFDRLSFSQDVASFVSRYHDMSGGQLGLGTAFLELVKLADVHDMPVPSSLTLLSKTMLNLDGAVSVLSPSLNPVKLISNYMVEVMEHRIHAAASPGKQFALILDIWQLFQNSPRRMDMLFDKLANDQFTIHLQVNRLEQVSRALNGLSKSIVIGSTIIAVGRIISGRLLSKGQAARKDRIDR